MNNPTSAKSNESVRAQSDQEHSKRNEARDNKQTWTGSCLCGFVSFELRAPLNDIYQCHCSKCRKVSGSASNSAMIINESQFRWLSGKEAIRAFQQISGFKSHFCSQCGCPVPNPTSNNSYWIPVGLMDEDIPAQMTRHVYVDSKANWDVVSHEVHHYSKAG